jgi:hypothetical protein
VGLGTWHWRKPENPFVFKANSPSVFLVHATTDKPVEVATNIIADLKSSVSPPASISTKKAATASATSSLNASKTASPARSGRRCSSNGWRH